MLLGIYLKVRVAKFLFGMLQEEISVMKCMNSSAEFFIRRQRTKNGQWKTWE